MTDTTDDERFDGHTHYFYDSDGHLYADLTAMREQGKLELVPLESGEVVVDVAEVRIEKGRPVLNLSLSVEGHRALENHFLREAGE